MRDFKINREKKTFVFDDGEELPIPENQVRQVLRTAAAKKYKEKEKEHYEKLKSIGGPVDTFFNQAHESFLGNPGATAGEYLISSAKAFKKGEGQEELSFIDRIKDNFYAAQEARKEYVRDLGERDPTASTLGKVAGTIGEIATLRKVPAVAAVPIIGAAHSDTSFLEPIEKGKEVAKDATVGFLLDRFFKGAKKVAGARKEIRASKQAIQEAEAINAAEMAPEAVAKRQAAYSAENKAYQDTIAQHEAAVTHANTVREKALKEVITPKSIRTLGEVESTLKKTLNLSEPIVADLERKFGSKVVSRLSSDIEKAIHETLKKNEANLSNMIKDGQLQLELADKIERLPMFRKVADHVDRFHQRVQGGMSQEMVRRIIPGYEKVQSALFKLPEDISSKFTQTLEGNLNSLPKPLKVPPPPIQAPQLMQPNLVPVPPVAQPSGMYGKLATGLENLTGKKLFRSAKQNAPLGVMAKLAGIPIAKTAATAAVGALGVKGLTSPSMAGNALREGLEQGGRFLQSIWSQAEKYPSFHDGILDNPQERRSLTKEIEDDQNIPLEEKAIYQSKINRGKPLNQPLQ